MKPLVRVGIVLCTLLCVITAEGVPEKRADQSPPKLPDPALLTTANTPLRAACEKMTEDARRQLFAHDYDGLEKLALQAETSKDVVPGGSIMPVYFYDGVSEIQPRAEAQFQHRLEMLQDWMKTRPDSPVPKVAMAIVMTDYAWFARGNGYANTVTDQGWKNFSDRLQQARDYLNQAADKRQGCCMWYCAMATIAMGQSWDKSEYTKMIEEEFAVKPDFVDLHGHVVVYLLPRWYGSNEELHDYITKASDRVGGDAGDVLYMRLARRVWCYSKDVNVIDEVGLSWPRLKHGLELTCNRYPASVMMANFFCLLACQAKDQPTAKLLFEHIGAHIDNDIWDNSLDASRAWALSN